MQSNSGPMTANQSGTARKLAIVASLGAMGFAGFAVALLATPGNIVHNKLAASPAPITNQPQAQSTANPGPVSWVAAAPGRVEPRSGQIRIGTALAARVVAVAVKANDKVATDEVLIRLDDKETRARLAAAESETAARKREREAQPANTGREAVTRAEDAVFAAERAVTNARFELDDMIAADRKSSGSPQTLSQARRRLADAQDRLRQENLAFASAQARNNIPAPSRFEAAVAAARTEVILAETMLERTRIRAPIAGTVLQLHAKAGEMVAPSEMPLATIGDMSLMRVRAEVDEQDVSKIKVGQRVFVRNNAYPGQEFEGKVAELAASLATPRMGSRGVRRATDVEVMEVLIDLDGNVPLLAGMRADAFFRR